MNYRCVVLPFFFLWLELIDFPESLYFVCMLVYMSVCVPCSHRKKNVLDKLYYTFMLKLVTGDQPEGRKGAPSTASLQLAIR